MKVLLVDDHPLMLWALRTVVEALHPGVQTFEAGSAVGARALSERHPDCALVLLDLQLGADDGFQLLAWIGERHPGIPIVVLSDTDSQADMIRAIDGGAMGFVPKRAPADVLTQALQLVLAGGIYVPPLQQGSDVTPLPLPLQRTQFAPALADPAVESDWEAELALTPRQTEVLAGLLQGKPNKLIARELGLSVDTIKDHVAAVLKVLGVNTRTQAVLAVAQLAQRTSEAKRNRQG